MTTFCWKFWKFCLNLNRTRLYKIKLPRARNNYTKVSTTEISFISSRRTRNLQFIEKHNSFSNFCVQVQFMLKGQQKLDIKLSKICQNHQKLNEWQKVASRFTEIVYKSSPSEDSRNSSCLSTSWILLNKGQPATEY